MILPYIAYFLNLFIFFSLRNAFCLPAVLDIPDALLYNKY